MGIDLLFGGMVYTQIHKRDSEIGLGGRDSEDGVNHTNEDSVKHLSLM